ncbi:hypothetical protein E4U58_002741 [Claviceps cyperi]|nr:hypothetical protein E4U58_002741 [Claviceps cyperi]
MPTAVAWIKNGLGKAATTLWRWSVPYRSSNRPDDDLFSAVWGISLDEKSVLDVLEPSFPSIPRHELPTTEGPIRRLVRERLPPPESPPTQEHGHDEGEKAIGSRGSRLDHNDSGGTTPFQDKKQMASATEEMLTHLAPDLRNLLAAMNAFHLENKLHIILEDDFHPPAGRKAIERSLCGINKTLMMWRRGYPSSHQPP